MSDVIKFVPKTPEDINYLVDNDGEIKGVSGKYFDMEFLTGGDGFLFNGSYIKREELIAFVLVSGLWQDVQDDEKEKSHD